MALPPLALVAAAPSLSRWPHPSPWWGQWLWPKVIAGLLVVLVVQVADALWQNWREDRRDGGGP